MEKEYWENFYKSQKDEHKPSLFAEFVLQNFIPAKSSIIELGCGNGRDSIFFAKNHHTVLAVDQCEDEIKLLAHKNDLENLKFDSSDFTRLNDVGEFDIIYSRFTLHSVNDNEEKKVIEWACKNIKEGGLFLIEARGRKNELYGKGEAVPGEEHAFTYEGHYRRFIDIEELKRRLQKKGFEIQFSKEETGFAPFNGTDECFMRVVATKGESM